MNEILSIVLHPLTLILLGLWAVVAAGSTKNSNQPNPFRKDDDDKHI